MSVFNTEPSADPSGFNASQNAPPAKPVGYLTFTLHAHLPYVVNHGTWPHGMEWLHEAAAETYLPLLRVLTRLERDGIALRCNLNISPVLMEQLAHPVFRAEFPHYVERKIVAAREDEAYFLSTNEHHYAETARFWHAFFSDALRDFEALDRDIVKGFRRFHENGLIEIITCGATHGYMPLLGTDESVRAQVRTAVQTHRRHIGEHPRGIWAPECGYRPAGFWDYPVANADGTPAAPGFDRIGVEQALSESGLEYFFVDTHLVEQSAPVASPYQLMHGKLMPHDHAPSQPLGHSLLSSLHAATPDATRNLYQPHAVDGPYLQSDHLRPVTVFPRDPRTGVQVWSGDSGYPGDANYLDFHKKRWPGGHRYWRVTGHAVDMNDKQPYFPKDAAERVREHASHFVHLVWQALHNHADAGNPDLPPVLCAPFDAELFGHWWFEGPLWLEAVARVLHDYPTGLQLTTCSDYLTHHSNTGFIAMREGSWGAEGTNHVWMNPDTAWTYAHIYPAELFTREVCTHGRWRDSGLGERVVKQLCRELLLLESSDWQFLITTGAARDYAELRFETHNDQFNELKVIWQIFAATGSITEAQQLRLAAIEERDSLFADIDPSFWATGAHDTPTTNETDSLLSTTLA